MRPALWVVGTTVAVLAIASACTGWGETPDPSASSAETISNILQLPGGATLDHVGHVIAENSILYAAAASRDGDYNTTVWVLRKEPDEEWSKVWTSKESSEPRLLARNGTLYWASSVGGQVSVQVWAPGDLESRTLCNLSYGNPAGIAQEGQSIFVFRLSSSSFGCEYSTSSNTFCDRSNDATLVSCLLSPGEAGGIGPEVEILANRPLLSNQMIDALVIEDRKLYWFEGKALTGSYKGAVFRELPTDGAADGGAPPEPAELMSLDDNSYPLGFARSFSTGDWFIASSAAVAADSSSYSGCTIWRLSKGASQPQVVMTDPSRTCRGMSADPVNLVLTTSWLDGSEPREGVMLLKAGATAFPSAFPVERAGIGLRETLLFQDAVLVRASGALLRIPLSLVP